MENFEWAPKAEKDDVVITLFSLLPALLMKGVLSSW